MTAEGRGSEHRRRGAFPPPSPLVERDRELAYLESALESGACGDGRAVLVEAAAGLGKSRLLAEAAVLAREQNMVVLQARATQGEQDFAFGLALQLLVPHLSGLRPSLRKAHLSGAAGVAQPLLEGALLPEDAHPPASPFALFHGLHWVMVNISAGAPLLVLVDDVQWADESSLRFLLYLVERVADSPIVLLMAARPLHRGHESAALAALHAAAAASILRLPPLGSPGMTDLVRLGAPGLPDDVCAACVEASDGNPFYLHELLLAIDGDVAGGPGIDPSRIRELAGATLARAALFRMLRLGPTAIALAEALAVLGGRAPLQLVAQLAEVPADEAADAADNLAAEQVITSGPVLEYQHPLINQSVFDEMRPGRRALAHAAAARLLHDAIQPVEQVAAQLLEAPAGDSAPWVVPTLREAAARASGRGSPESAVRYLRRASDEPSDPDVSNALLVEFGTALTAAGVTGGADHLRTALVAQRDPVRRAEISRLLASSLVAEGRAVDAADTLEQALDSHDAGSEALRTGLLADFLVHASFEPGLRQRAIARTTPLLGEPPRTEAAGPATPDSLLLLAALALRSAQGWHTNDATLTLVPQAWAAGKLLATDGPDGPGWLMTAWAHLLAEDASGARRVSADALTAARRAGSVGAFAAASYFHGFANLALGRLVEAQADAEQVIAAEHAEWHRYLVPALTLRAQSLLERGETSEAANTLQRAAGAIRGGMLDVPWTQHGEGLLDLARHRPAEAIEHFERAGEYLSEKLAVENTVLPWRIGAALAALALGDRGRAHHFIAVELDHAGRRQAVVARGRAMRAQGLATDAPETLELLCESVDLLEGTGAELELAYALTDLGAALRRSGHRVDARSRLETALCITRRLDAGLLGARVREELAAAGVRSSPIINTGASALTPSELRVANLACEGLTNLEIAQALFVSPKTVEYHLRHVYQRLGISKRRQIRSVLSEAE